MRMVVFVLALLLLMQLPIIFALEFLNSEACGTYRVGYSSDFGRELFYLNGELVNKDLFCNSIKLNHANHCFVARKVASQCCEVDLFSEVLPMKVGRRFLRNLATENTQKQDESNAQSTKNGQNYVLKTTHMAMAGPGLLILCCSFLCPCFRARSKDTAHAALVKEPISLDSSPSIEMNSISQKIHASPQRVPPSPGRFSRSQNRDRDGVGSVQLTLSQIERATQNFSSSRKLGEGGFGTVYKAQLQDGQIVAVKRAHKKNFDALRSEFKTEVELLAKIEHRNLVKLLGYVDKGNERLIITEYVPNGTLRDHLDGVYGSYLDFSQRLEISIDIAHGLTYLHLYAEKQIIHRDVKSTNILLTERMKAKVADFGFARFGNTESDKTHILTKVKGTVGYLDPEYMKTYKLTPKSDVYSFGNLLIEILTGRRPVESKRTLDEKVTIRWAFAKFDAGETMDLVDPQMKGVVDKEIFDKMLGLAFQCAAPTRADRPDMKSVGERLWVIRMDYLKHGTRE